MRGSMFVANAWGRHPLRPFTPVRMGQNVVCEGDVCRVEPPPADPVVLPPSGVVTNPKVVVEEFPIVPVAVGAGALILALAIL